MLKHAFQDNLKDARLQDGLSLSVDLISRPGFEVVLVINGLDRLIMELKLPPTDAYHKCLDRRMISESKSRQTYWEMPPLRV